MPTVNIQGVGRVGFPDGMSEQDIATAIEQDILPNAQRQQRLEALKKSNPGEYDPQSPEYRAKYGATSSMTGTQKFLAGAGKSVVDVGRGLKQIGTQALGADPAAIQADIDASRERDAELMGTGAGLAGNVAGTLATTLIPAGVVARGAQAANLARTANVARSIVNPRTFRAAAAVGAGQGALLPVATGENRALHAAIGAAGGALGTGAAKVVGRVAQPVKQSLTRAGSRAVLTLEAAGVPLDLAQRTGSRFAQRMKNMLQDNPITAGAQTVQKEQQQRAYNTAILATIGERADAATPGVLSRAQARLGQVFDDVAERNPVQYSKGLETRLTAIEKAARDELDDAQFSVVRRQLDNILQKAADGGNQIDGKAYQNIKTGLDRLSSNQDQSKGFYARQIREALDDSLQRSAAPQDLAALRIARTQYRRLKQIESAVGTDEAGHISAAKLANSLGAKRNVAQSKYGRGDQVLVRLAKSGKQILPEPTPNSGTPSRLLAQLALPGALGIGGAMFSDDPMMGVNLAAAGYVLPKLASGAVKPGAISNYLAGGLGNPWVRAALQSPQQSQLVGGLLKGTARGLALGAPQ